jgi:hypothetical protein
MKVNLRNGAQGYIATLHDVISAIQCKTGVGKPLSLSATATSKPKDWSELIPSEYHDFKEIFIKENADKLPPHRPGVDHEINLKDGCEPPFKPIYSLSLNELTELREYIDENLKKGFIRASNSPAGAPILFAKKQCRECRQLRCSCGKKDHPLRLCIDYRGLNEVTIKNRYPLPLIQDTIDRLKDAKYFTKIDLRGAYNLIRIKKGDEWKTAFRTRYGHFEYQVMPFGLTNAPATFQYWMNEALREGLDQFCNVYLDDISIYSKSLEEHRKHVRWVLTKLRDIGAHVKPEKCDFHTGETEFLGFIISRDGVKMNPNKISTIQEWQPPKSVKEVQGFLGFANFYRRFIEGYSKVANPLFELTKKTNKSKTFQWTEKAQEAFDTLKKAFCTAPILAYYDPNAPCILETDASDYVVAAILSQPGADQIIRPVAFYSRKMAPAECNYEIYDKELLAIVAGFKEYRQYLEGAKHKIEVITDHSNLKYFRSTKVLTRRQVRWSLFLEEFDYSITYRPGTAGGKPDALTRRPQDFPTEGDERTMQQSQILLPDERFNISATTVTFEPSPLLDQIKSELSNDKIACEILEEMNNGTRRSKRIQLSECTLHDGLLLYQQRIYVPDSEQLKSSIVQQNHDNPAVGHPGRARTFEILSRNYYWPGMRRFVHRYVDNCDTCSRSKPVKHAPYGLLKPLEAPSQPWSDISMDVITDLPPSDGFNAILVVVDRLTKMAHYIPCCKEETTTTLVDLYLKNVFKLHGLPTSIVSDRGPMFASDFWRQLLQRLKIERKLSTAYHPETDGQTERINAILEQYLRCYCSYQQDDWAKWLPIAEFAHNNTYSDTIKNTPFYGNFGYNPRWDFDLTTNENNSNPDVSECANQLAQIHENLKAEMINAQDEQAEYANRRRKIAPRYLPGDKVWLLRRNIKTTRPCDKLDFKRLGKFTVIRAIGSHAYELQLPRSMRIHPVFHVSLLEPAADNPVEGQPIDTTQQIETDSSNLVVEEILDSRISRDRLQFRVKWVGHTRSDGIWYEAERFLGNAGLIHEFYRKYPEKPKTGLIETINDPGNEEETLDSITVTPLQLSATITIHEHQPHRSFGLEEGATVMNQDSDTQDSHSSQPQPHIPSSINGTTNGNSPSHHAPARIMYYPTIRTLPLNLGYIHNLSASAATIYPRVMNTGAAHHNPSTDDDNTHTSVNHTDDDDIHTSVNHTDDDDVHTSVNHTDDDDIHTSVNHINGEGETHTSVHHSNDDDIHTSVNHTDDDDTHHVNTPVNNPDDDDSSETSTISDYTLAWQCYRTQYMQSERVIHTLARHLWSNFTHQQRAFLGRSYGHIINATIREVAPQQGILRMRQDGWGHVLISPHHLHTNILPDNPHSNVFPVYEHSPVNLF